MDFSQAHRIVIKVGSALLVDEQSSRLNEAWLKRLIHDIAFLKKHDKGKDIVLVTSGAIAVGCSYLNIERTSLKLEEKQAVAACGQPQLFHHVKTEMQAHDLPVAQILLTIEDSENRRRYLNARHTIDTLLHMGVIPIINENDTVATDELRIGDNDRLAARVAQMISADILVLLSDIDGLYDKNPHLHKDAQLIPTIHEITPDIEAMGGNVISDVGTGGMATKIAAAKIAVDAGCHMAITKGDVEHPVLQLDNGGRCSWFVSDHTPTSSRKHWIKAILHTTGNITIDAGAERALQKGSSLLPAGVTAISGKFNRGDAIDILNSDGLLIAKGLVAYPSEDAQQIIGCQTQDIAGILGYEGRGELVHRDDLVLND